MYLVRSFGGNSLGNSIILSSERGESGKPTPKNGIHLASFVAYLFIGAYHEVISKLPADIRAAVKEVIRVREYHRVITSISIET